MKKLATELGRLSDQLSTQGFWLTFWAGVDKVIRWSTGGPSSRFSRLTDSVWLGGQPLKRGLSRLIDEEGMTGFVNLRSEYHYEHLTRVGKVRYLHLPTEDNEAPTCEHLAAGVDFICSELQKGGKVYLHCWEGLGRGPTMAAAYFVSTGLDPERAWARVRETRPFIRPTPKQLERLRDFARTYRPMVELDKLKVRQQQPLPPSGV